MNKRSIYVKFLIVIGIIIMANLIADQLYLRLDFTADQRYTLSNATKDVLTELEDVVTVKAYFSEDLPPQLLNNKRDFEDQLIEYENRASGNIVYEFINPNESEELEREAQQAGINPVIINVTEKDQVQQMKAYMGASLSLGDRTEVIPLIQPGAAMEYDLTTAIKKVAIEDKPKVGLLQGHGEPGLNAFGQLRQQLSVLYDVETFTLDEGEVPTFYKAIIVANPSDTIPAGHLAKLDNYLNIGGSIFVAKNTVDGDLQNAQLLNNDPIGITRWLSDKGISIGQQFVVDANCAAVSVRQQTGFFTVNTQVNFPYFPRIGEFGDHPITQGLEGILLPFVSNVRFTNADTAVTSTPLLWSSEQSGFVSAPGFIDINKKWSNADFTAGSQPLAIAVEGNITGNGNSRLVVVGNGTFFNNGENGQQQQSPDNINFASNAIDWLADDTGLIDLRTKGITSRPLDKVEDDTKALLKYGNVFLPILLVLIYALIRRQINARKKQKWLQGIY